MTTKIMIQLSRAEALVLFDWITSAEEAEKLPVSHPAEERVLWELEAQLEHALSEPFASNYKELLAAAREEILRNEQ